MVLEPLKTSNVPSHKYFWHVRGPRPERAAYAAAPACGMRRSEEDVPTGAAAQHAGRYVLGAPGDRSFVDDVDVAILRAMGTRNFGPVGSDRDDLRPARVAEKVGLDPSTVYARIKRMEASGLIAGYELTPNLALFGLRESVYVYRQLSTATKAELFERLALVDGVLMAHDFFRTSCCIVLTFRGGPERDRRLALLEQFTGVPGELVFDAPLPPVARPLDPVDWRLLCALRQDALKSVNVLAAQLGLSARTVRRRLDALTQANAYFCQPTLDPSRGDGFVPTGFLIWLKAEGRSQHLQRVRDVAGPRLLFDTPAAAQSVYLMAALRNPAEVTRMEALLSQTQGVGRVEANLVQGIRSYGAWLDELARSHAEGHGLSADVRGENGHLSSPDGRPRVVRPTSR